MITTKFLEVFQVVELWARPRAELVRTHDYQMELFLRMHRVVCGHFSLWYLCNDYDQYLYHLID